MTHHRKVAASPAPNPDHVQQQEPAHARRKFLNAAATLGSGLLLPLSIWGCTATRQSWSTGNPFSLGVAAGTPSDDGFVIWTRLAPDPLCTDPALPGGMQPGSYPVRYEVAGDPEMRSVVRKGEAIADAQFAYSIHVELTGLAPNRSYWYRFYSGEAESRIGKATTLPAAGANPSALKLGFVSCSHYEEGYFSAYRHLADEHPDFVLFLGDYIYENVQKKHPVVRKHSDRVAATTLPLYRNRYAQYRLDADLQRLHAEVPSIMTWDDHEVQNDYADQWSETFDDPKEFLKRRAAAYQAFYEHMPVRPSRSTPSGPAMRVYDRFTYGRLTEISLLDGRQYRSREACYRPPNKGGAHGETTASCPERLEENRSMLGAMQERWLYDSLAKSSSTWNLIAQDVLMAEVRQREPDNQISFWTDDWNGYPAARTRLIRQLHEAKVSNPVVLSGDIHSYWANDLKLDFGDPDSKIVATEFVGTSITSRPPPYDVFIKYMADNPHIRYFESRKRGYATVDVTPGRLTTRFRAISNETDINASVSTLKTFVVESGRPGAIAG